MNAYKCDICGKYFENSRVKTGSPWRVEEEVDGHHKFTIGVVNTPEKFLLFDGDICPDCIGYFCVGLCERGCRDEKIKMYAADYIRKAHEEMRTKTLGTPVEEEAEESGES